MLERETEKKEDWEERKRYVWSKCTRFSSNLVFNNACIHLNIRVRNGAYSIPTAREYARALFDMIYARASCFGIKKGIMRRKIPFARAY
jgi:hypothetical protein